MAIREAIVNERIERELNSEGLSEVLASLWAGDCQSCGKPLGATPPVLSIDDHVTSCVAQLFHPGCRKSEWNDSGASNFSSEPCISWTTQLIAVSTTHQSTNVIRVVPILILNPSLERISLKRSDNGAWLIGPDVRFVKMGLKYLGREGLPLNESASGMVARLGSSELSVTGIVLPFTYTVKVDERDHNILEPIREQGGVLLIVTHDINPAVAQDPESLLGVLNSEKALFGWIDLESVHRTRPKPPPVIVKRTLLLHSSRKATSVGYVLAHTRKSFSDARAKKWAARILSKEGARIIPWNEFSDGMGFFTIDAISVTQYALRYYPDGWRLSTMISRIDGPSANTETEAQAWAARVLEFRDLNLAPLWRRGPSPADDIITLYADV